jgi:hypothetical protein
MKSTLEESSAFENSMEFMSNNRAVERFAVLPREDEAKLIPLMVRGPFKELPLIVACERLV